MEEKRKWDRDRGEWYPPIVPEPYVVVRGTKTPFMLKRGEEIIDHLRSVSEHGARREANIIIKNLDF